MATALTHSINKGVRTLSYKIGGFSDGPVYRTSSGKVAKFEWARDWTRLFCNVSPIGKIVQKEYNIARELYESGVSVPIPYGVFRFKKPSGKTWAELGFPTTFPGFLMQYIEGIKPLPRNLKERDKSRVNDMVFKELEKARDLGFVTIDGNLENAIWVPEQKKVYLIDFAKWFRK